MVVAFTSHCGEAYSGIEDYEWDAGRQPSVRSLISASDNLTFHAAGTCKPHSNCEFQFRATKSRASSLSLSGTDVLSPTCQRIKKRSLLSHRGAGFSLFRSVESKNVSWRKYEVAIWGLPHARDCHRHHQNQTTDQSNHMHLLGWTTDRAAYATLRGLLGTEARTKIPSEIRLRRELS